MLSTPVLFIAFNRPIETAFVLDALRKVEPHKLYVSVDGPREAYPADEEKCKRVKEIVSGIDWICDVKYFFHEENQGCFKAVSGAINWFFEFEEQGIILEDDCLPSLDFFIFCEKMLERYRNDNRVISINGCNLGYNLQAADSYTFSRYMNMWGWATWKRCVVEIDYELNEWRYISNKTFFIYSRLRNSLLDFDLNWYKFWVGKFNEISLAKNLHTWDWQWLYYQFKNKKLAIVPGQNLVTNIGFNSLATHTQEPDNPASNIEVGSLSFPLKHPKKVRIDIAYEEKYVKWIWSYYKRLPFTFYVKKLFRNIIIKDV